MCIYVHTHTQHRLRLRAACVRVCTTDNRTGGDRERERRERREREVEVDLMKTEKKGKRKKWTHAVPSCPWSYLTSLGKHYTHTRHTHDTILRTIEKRTKERSGEGSEKREREGERE